MPFNESKENLASEYSDKSGGPPLSWFIGVGYKNEGIKSIAYSDELTSMGNGEVGKQLGEWSHYMGNARLKNEEDESRPDIRDIVVQAREIIKSITGFTPREIQDKRSELLNQFRHKTEAPFEFELH